MKKRVVILGGGFVGTSVAVKLASRHRQDVEVVLLSPTDRFLFSPLLIDVLAQDLSPKACGVSLSFLASRHAFSFIHAEATLVDRTQQEIRYQRTDGNKESIPYDYAVLATGAKINYYHLPGAETYCLSLKTEKDVERLWERLNERIVHQNNRPFSIVLIGAGPSGIEALYAIKASLHRKRIDPARVSFHLLEATEKILPGFDPEIQRTVDALLRKENVTIHTGKPVQRIQEQEIILADATIPYDLALWCAGIQPNPPPLFPALTGPLCPDLFLRLDDHLFTAGDVASIAYEGTRLPKTGQVALQLAETISQNISRSLSNAPLLPLRATHRSFLLSLGKTGIIKFGSFVFQTRWTTLIRRTLYRIRLWQIQHGR